MMDLNTTEILSMRKYRGKNFNSGLGLFLVMTMVVAIYMGPCGCGKEKPSLLKNKIKIGVIYPQSGPDASTGEDIKAGIELAREIVNGSYDLPIPLAKTKGLFSHGDAVIEVVYRDSKSDPEEAFKAVEKLVREDKVVAVMGDYRSTVTARASQKAEILGVPFLNALSTSPVLTRQGLKWFFRTTPDDEIFAQNFFNFLSDLSVRDGIAVPKRIVLVYENNLFGTSVSQAEKKLALRNNFKIAGDIPYSAEAKQFAAELRAIKKALPAIILQTSYLNDAVLFMKGYKARGINPAAILAMDAGFISPDFTKSLGPDAEYVMSREVWALDLAGKKPLVRQVDDLFRNRFKRDMEGNSARAFTGLIVMAEAINRSTSLNPEDIRKSLTKTDITAEQLIMPWNGVRFDPNGQNRLGLGIIVQVQRGKYRTIWPPAAAEKKAVWPLPAWSTRRANQ
jgi:branched-chain amino acid transport system substrate-binding protein